jgi:hypothetical protein
MCTQPIAPLKMSYFKFNAHRPFAIWSQKTRWLLDNCTANLLPPFNVSWNYHDGGVEPPLWISFLELNIEHGRKRNKRSKLEETELLIKTESSYSPPSLSLRVPSIPQSSDARLDALLSLELKYMELMTSDKVPIYNSIEESLTSSDTIFHDDIIRKRVGFWSFALVESHCNVDANLANLQEVAPTDPSRSTFWYWRGKTLSIYIDWAKTFNIFQCLSYSDKVQYYLN